MDGYDMALLLAVVLLASLGATRGVEPKPIQFHYHEHVGIPQAARIQQAESAIDFDGSRIVGGSAVPVNFFTFTVGVVITLTNGALSTCGATMVSNSRALSAAHCWRDGRLQARRYHLVFGSEFLFAGGVRRDTTDIVTHPNYNTTTLYNDIAVVSFEWVEYTNLVQSAHLNMVTNNQYDGIVGEVIGYGVTTESADIGLNQVKRRVWMRVISNAECAETYGPDVVGPATMCAIGINGASVGPCTGDSGGPFTLVTTLIGVISYNPLRGCQPGLPALFARVTSFNAWIQSRL